MTKLNIIFDGNFLLHKTKNVFLSYNKEASLTEALQTKEARATFLRKVITDFCFTTNQIIDNSINVELGRIIVVFDKDQSWRKEIYSSYKFKEKDDGTEEEGKKYFYEVMSTFKKLITKRGIITSDVSRLEGDDLCWIWSKSLLFFSINNEKEEIKERNIIVTADRDVVQAVDKRTVVFNNNSTVLKLYSIAGTRQDILNKSPYIDHVKVEPKEYLFKKILIGDSGDNIPNVIRGMGEKKVDSITALIKELDLLQCNFESEEYISKIAIVCNSQFNNKKDEEELVRNIRRNASLIQINHIHIPKDLFKEAQTEFKEKKDTFSYKGKLDLSNILKQESNV